MGTGLNLSPLSQDPAALGEPVIGQLPGAAFLYKCPVYLHRAAALLSESTYNVTEAALTVGFESLSHFNATFRSFMGVSPKHYVRRV